MTLFFKKDLVLRTTSAVKQLDLMTIRVLFINTYLNSSRSSYAVITLQRRQIHTDSYTHILQKAVRTDTQILKNMQTYNTQQKVKTLWQQV